MGRERLAERSCERDPFLDRRNHLGPGAVEVDDQRNLGPAAARGIELRGEVMEVEHIGVIGVCGAEWGGPGLDEMIGAFRQDGGEHRVRRPGAGLR